MIVDFNKLAPLNPTMSNAHAVGFLWAELSAVDHSRLIENSGLSGQVMSSDLWREVSDKNKKILIAQWYLEIRSVIRLLKNWPPLYAGAFSMATELLL